MITPEQKQAVENLEAAISRDDAYTHLNEDIPRLREAKAPEQCLDRLREMFTRRYNGGRFTYKDVEFFNAIYAKGNSPDAILKACKESGNTFWGQVAGFSFFAALAVFVGYRGSFKHKPTPMYR